MHYLNDYLRHVMILQVLPNNTTWDEFYLDGPEGWYSFSVIIIGIIVIAVIVYMTVDIIIKF